jgi:uncharacterized protein
MDASTLTGLLPPEVSPLLALALVLLSFFTSALTAAAGIGGGVVMLSVMASVLPPLVVIPVHGVVQLGSNVGRAVLLRPDIHWRLLVLFGIGAMAGAAAGARLFVALPVPVLQLLLGLFILYAVWGPRLRPADLPEGGFVAVGLGATFLTMFVGATGPFVAAFLSPARLGRNTVVATHAACMSLQHGLKAIAFGFIGFAFAPWIALLAAMITSGFLGTLAGRSILVRLPERLFARIFSAVLTVLALRLLWQAAGGWGAG